jgi:hypothetical protein
MSMSRRSIACLGLGAAALLAAPRAHAQSAKESGVKLFKVITVKDEIVIGLSAEELSQIGGQDAGAVARSLADRREMSVWRYAVRKDAKGELEQAPLAKVGLLANASLRVEPYSTPLKIVPHE